MQLNPLNKTAEAMKPPGNAREVFPLSGVEHVRPVIGPFPRHGGAVIQA